MLKTRFCAACSAQRNGVKTRIAIEHTCVLSDRSPVFDHIPKATITSDGLIPISDSHLGKVNTVTGIEYDFLNPTPSMIWLDDIAQGLANECRFGGQIRQFYSVAQHSVLVSCIVPKEFAMEALFHDAHESIFKDITSPLKRLIGDEYKRLCCLYDGCVAQKFNLKHPLDHPTIKEADKILLEAESNYLRHNDRRYLRDTMYFFRNDNKPLNPIWTQQESYNFFIYRHYQIKNEINHG